MNTRFFRASGGVWATSGRKRLFLVACLVTVASAFGGWLLTRGATTPENGRDTAALPGERSRDRTDSATRAPRDVARDGRWRIGERRVYSVASSMHLGSEPTDPNGAVDLTGDGTLSLTVVTDDAESVVLRGELLDFAGTYGSSAGEARAPEEALEKPFGLTLARRGSVESVAIHPELVGIWHALLRTIVATTQFVERDARTEDRRRWQTEESDQLGRYRAEYEAVGPGTFRKTKGVYSHIELAHDLLRSGRTPKMSSTTDFTVDSNGLVRRAEAVETTNVQLGATTLVSSTRVTLVLKSVDRGDRGSTEGWMTVQSPLYENRAAGLNPETEAERKRKLVSGASFETLALELRKATPGSDERWAAIERLTALFDLDPEAIAEARRLLTGRLAPEDARGIMGALANASRPEAQAVLTGIAKNEEQEDTTRHTALVHLTVSEAPTESTLTELAALAETAGDGELHDRAVLALGGAAGNALKQSGSEDAAARAVETLERGVERSTDEKSRSLYLTALGNAGTSSSFDLLKEQLGDANPNTRSAALQAMRFIPGAEVDTILAEFMLKDADPIVRRAAIVAAAYRELAPPVARAAPRLLQSEPIESLRFEVLRALGEKLVLAGQRAVIESVASNDTSASIRAKANSLLGRGD
jgi:hypothetical protein